MENFSFCAVEALRKLHMQLEVPSCLRYGPKSLHMHMLKLTFFDQLPLLSNNHVLMSYLRGIYLGSWFSWLVGGVQKTLKRRRKQTEEKH